MTKRLRLLVTKLLVGNSIEAHSESRERVRSKILTMGFFQNQFIKLEEYENNESIVTYTM
jgi:hypothetical protein